MAYVDKLGRERQKKNIRITLRRVICMPVIATSNLRYIDRVMASMIHVHHYDVVGLDSAFYDDYGFVDALPAVVTKRINIRDSRVLT
jgi:hypothetical protein